MEASFGDVSMSVRTVHLKWESKALEMTPTLGTVQFSWKDQGWGNQKGEIFLLLMSPSGEEKASYNLTGHIAPHEWEDIKVELVATDAVLAQATAGCWYQVKADAWKGGGHELYIKDFVLRLAEHVQQSTELSFGDFTVYGNTTNLNKKPLEAKPVTGTIQCRWKDQGWWLNTGMLTLKLMAPDGEEKASLPLSEENAPHEWEDIKVELTATDPVLELAEVGCWYQVVADVGGIAKHQLYVEDLVLRLDGPAPKHAGHSFGDASIALTHVQLKSQSEALQATPVSGSIQCRWKDQGFGNQRGRIYLKLMAPDGAEKASLPLTDNFSPHEWEDVKVDLVATDPVLAQATAGCTYHVMADEGEGNGHEIYVEDCVLRIEV